MAQEGSSLQNTNNQLVKYIEEIKTKKDAVSRELLVLGEERSKVESQMNQLKQKLRQLDEAIQKKNNDKISYEKTLHETQTAFRKILESSQTLLHVLKKEMV